GSLRGVVRLAVVRVEEIRHGSSPSPRRISTWQVEVDAPAATFAQDTEDARPAVAARLYLGRVAGLADHAALHGARRERAGEEHRPARLGSRVRRGGAGARGDGVGLLLR